MAESGTVLVIDDDTAIKDVLFQALRSAGYDVVEAATGELGLRVAKKFTPQLVVLDIGLPGIDGYEVAQRLREMPETAHVPIILSTGLRRHQVEAQGQAAGADYYIQKPYNPQDLAVDIYTLFHFDLDVGKTPQEAFRVLQHLAPKAGPRSSRTRQAPPGLHTGVIGTLHDISDLTAPLPPGEDLSPPALQDEPSALHVQSLRELAHQARQWAEQLDSLADQLERREHHVS